MNKKLLAGLGELLRSVTSSLPARREEGARDQQTQSKGDQQERKIDAPSAKPSVTTVWWEVCRGLVERTVEADIQVVTPWCVSSSSLRLLRKTPRAQARTKRVNVRMKRVRALVVAVVSRGANAVGKTAAGKDEQDDWKLVGKAGKSYADVVKKREKQPLEGQCRRSG